MKSKEQVKKAIDFWIGVNVIGLPEIITHKIAYYKREFNERFNNQLRKRIKF